MNRTMEYALIGLKHFYNRAPHEVVSAKELADCYGLSYELISKVMQKMTKEKILNSIQGFQGGYELNRSLKDFSLYDLMISMMGPLKMVDCLKEETHKECDLKTTCNIVEHMFEINNVFIDTFKSIPISKLVKSTKEDAKTKLNNLQ